MPMVSILVTVFNRGEFLAATLESILNSSYSDFEVIVVDDNSTDDSLVVAEKFAEFDKRIQVHVNDKNLGDYPNRNRAASLAQGKYIKYLDADDLIYRYGLSTMVEALEKYPEAALALSSNIIDPDSPYPCFLESVDVYRKHFLGQSPIGVGPSAAIIRLDCFDAVGGFSGKQFVGDTELWLQLADRWSIATLPPSLVWWRRHEGQQIALEEQHPEVLDIRYQLEKVFLKETQLLSKFEKQDSLERLQQRHARRLLALALKQRKPRVAWALYRQSGITNMKMFEGLRKYRV